MAIQPSLVQFNWSDVRGEEVEVGRLYDDGFLFLKDDPGVWIQSNPDSLSSVRSLELDLIWYEGESIGDSIGELSQLTHLCIDGRKSNLKCLPNTLSKLHHLHHLELSPCDELEDLPPNFGDLYNLTSLCLRPCDSLKLIESVAKLSNLTTLVISQLKELPPNLGGLYNLKSLTIDDCENYVIESVTKLSNLTTLTICDYGKLEELPANLGDLKFLASLFLDGCFSLRCLPWSITKLSNLRFLHLPEQFRLETLPPHLNDSIIISVEETHIRKTWKELKTQITEIPIITEELAAQKTYTPGYLQFKGDPTLWIRDSNNYGLHSSLRVLGLDLGDWSCKGKIPDSIGELSQLTHLYITKVCLPHQLPPTFTRLKHLSLIECDTKSYFDSLGNLSTLTSLHLSLEWDAELPKHIDLPISLTHLSLECCYSSIPDSFMASMVGKLSNLNTLTLSYCGVLESLPLHLNLTKLILRGTGTSIKSLPIGLKHLEIIHVICRGEYCKKLQECWRNQLVNLETLSYTCHKIESLSSLTSIHNLQKLQLKDCFCLKELPQDLDKLEKLCTLDVSGTRIQSLPNSIINLHNLRRLILPKCFKLYTLPPDFENKVMISVDDTDESYYKREGYHAQRYEIINDYNYMTSDSIKETNEKFLEKFKQATITIIEQASPHRPLNHQPDATRIIEGSQFNGSTDPTSNNNPNAFISSPNHEIENLPTSNEAGKIFVVVNEYCSDVQMLMDIVLFDKVTISVDETDESYYKHAGYYDSVYELSDDEDSINSNSTEDDTEIVAESRQEAIIEQASPHRPLNHPPDEIQILEDPTSNDNPNAFISSPNHEIKNLPTSNEAGTIPFVVNEYYSDVNANTMQVHVPKKLAAFNTDIPNFPYRNNIPAVIMDYLVGWNDVEADGNCGFRCVAEVFHGGQENWPMARQAILNELKAHPDVYQKIYFDDYSSTLQRIDWGGCRCGEEHYMEIVADLFPIANCYQCPVMCFTMTADGLNPQFSVTVFPWNVAAHNTRPTKELTIAHLGKCKHYILLDLKDDFPVPPIHRRWYEIIDKTVVDWDSPYETRRQSWDLLTNRSRDSTHLDISDGECFSNSSANTRQDYAPMEIEAAGSGFHLHETISSRENSQEASHHERMDHFKLEMDQGIAPYSSINSVDTRSKYPTLENGQDEIARHGKVKKKPQKIEITRESIQLLLPQGMRLEDAAMHLQVSRSTFKRALKNYGITWPSSRKRKLLDSNKSAPHNTISSSGRNLSLLNSVDPADPSIPTGHDHMVVNSDGPNQCLLPYNLPSEHNIVNKSTSNAVMRTVEEPPMSTHCHIDGHQRVEEHSNGAKECTLLNNAVQPHESCSSFVVKATYNNELVRFDFSLSSSMEQLEKEVGKRFKLEVGKFKMYYEDDEKELILIPCISDLGHALRLSKKRGSNIVRLSIKLLEG